MSATTRARDERRGMIAKIHVAKKQLALTDDTYRAILERVTGVVTTVAMNEVQLDSVLREFKRLGWSAERNTSTKAQVRAVHAMWRDMAHLVMDPSPNGLRGFVKRQTGLDDPEFCTPQQLNKVVEGLKAWRRRVEAKTAGYLAPGGSKAP